MHKSNSVIFFLTISLVSISLIKTITHASACYQFVPIDQNLTPITQQNIDQIVEIASWELDQVEELFVAPVGKAIVVLTSGDAQIYSFEENSPELQFLAECVALTNIAMTSSGSLTVIKERGVDFIQVYDATTDLLYDLVSVSNDYISDIELTSDGHLLAWASSNSLDDGSTVQNATIHIYDMRNKIEVATLANVADIVSNIHFLPDGKTLIFRGSYPGYSSDIQIWDIETQQPLSIREEWLVTPAYTQSDFQVALAITTSLGITDNFSHHIEVSDILQNVLVRSWNIEENPSRNPFALPDRIPALALNSEISIVISGDDEGLITIWNTTLGRDLRSFQAYSGSVEQVDLSSDRTYIVSLGSDETSKAIRIWGIGLNSN